MIKVNCIKIYIIIEQMTKHFQQSIEFSVIKQDRKRKMKNKLY